MNRADLLKKLLPGFVPLFVFILADEIWGTKIGLYVALAVGVGELLFIWIREKRFDKFILFDTLLLIALGGISILLNNDLFFKLKPGLIELILIVILGVSAFSPLNIIGLMSKRYMQNIEFNEAQVKQMRRSLKYLFYLFLLHTLLVFYATFYMSNEAWAFISGGLFYVIFGLYFVFELARQRFFKKRVVLEDETEWIPLVDDEGKIIGKALREMVHKGEKLLHPVVHLHVINRNKTLLLQKRPQNKLIEPGKWDSAVGGHICLNETLETALKREAFEEIGLKDFAAKLVKVFKWETELEAELVYLFITSDSKNIKANTTEVDEIKFWTKNQLQKAVGKNILTPNLEYELEILKAASII